MLGLLVHFGPFRGAAIDFRVRVIFFKFSGGGWNYVIIFFVILPYFRRRREICSSTRNFFVFSSVRLPPEDGSDRRETLGKRVSDDLQHFIFRRQKKILDEIFSQKQKMA